MAGTIESIVLSETLMPDARRELLQKRPASHTSALGELFIADESAIVQEKVWGGREVYQVGSGWPSGALRIVQHLLP